MPRQQRIRGQEATIRISEVDKDGNAIPLEGSFFKVRDFTWNDVGDLKEDDFLGEVASDVDYQNHGFAGSFTIDKSDAAAIDFVSRLVVSDRFSQKPPQVSITVSYVYREPGVEGTLLIFSEALMMMSSESLSGRKEFVNNSFEFKSKHLIVR